MTGWSLTSGTFFGALLLVTAAAQLRRWRWTRWMKARDACAFIPTWTFFAPNPGVTDTRVLWREQLADGSTSAWHELVPPPSGLLRAIWNPTKRARKGVTDCGPMVHRLVAQNKGSKLPVLSLPYLMLSQHICARPGSPIGLARQFVVLNTQGADSEANGQFRVLFISHWQRLAGVGADVPLPAPGLPELDAEAVA